MKNKGFSDTIRLFFLIVLFNLIFCALCRVVSILFTTTYCYDVFLSFYHGIQFDLIPSIAIALIILVFQLLFFFLTHKTKIILLKSTLILLLFLQLGFSAIDWFLLKSWNTLFNIRAIKYIVNPQEVYNTIAPFQLVIILIIALSFYIVFQYLYAFLLKKRLQVQLASSSIYLVFIGVIILLPFTFLIFRGGLREIPLNQSDAYFSQNRMVNLITLNSSWNFFNTIVEHNQFIKKNPYKVLDTTTVNEVIQSIQKSDATLDISMFNLKQNHPNIILITMEGINAELLTSTQSMHFLEELIDSSYYFSEAYSVGFRTEQGIAALLSGSFSTPYNNITDNVSYLNKIPSILTSFKSRNYKSSFIFGGNIEFANMKAYLLQMGFDKIIEENDYLKTLRTQKLGVPDEFLFKKAYEEIEQNTNPYFIQIMTQSTHEPYDYPLAPKSVDESELYVKSAKYLDDCLRNFFKQLDEKQLLCNTIVIITSDHAHFHPGNYEIGDEKRYHTPLIIYSKLMNKDYKGKKDTILFRQNNFPATLAFLLSWKEKNYMKYSQNHFSNSPKFTFTSFVNGYLYQSNNKKIAHDYTWWPVDMKSDSDKRENIVPLSIMQHITEEIRGQ